MRTRNRTRTAINAYGKSYREYNIVNNPPAWTVVKTPTNYSWNNSVESIVDDIGPRTTRALGAFRPCTHTRASISQNAALDPESILTADFPRWYGTLRVQSKGYVSDIMRTYLSSASSVANSYPAGYAVDFDNFASLAKSTMLPSLSDGSSVLNFIYELKDFKRLGQALLRTWYKQTNLLGVQYRLMSDVWWAAWGSNPWDFKPSKVSAGYLAWRFCWQPFVNDCKRILGKLLAFRKKIRSFERGQKQRQQRYFGKNVPISFIGGEYKSDYSPSLSAPGSVLYGNVSTGYFGFCQRRQEASEPLCRMHATMRYTYVLPASVKSMDGFISAFLDYLGVNANPAIIWNAIPFSFIVDWFVNIGGCLERLRVDNIRATTTVSKFCVSAKFERNYVVGLLPYCMRSSSDTPRFFSEIGVATRSTRYERRVFEPETIGVWLDSGGGLTGDRVSLAAALAHANRPQRRKALTLGFYNASKSDVTANDALERYRGLSFLPTFGGVDSD